MLKTNLHCCHVFIGIIFFIAYIVYILYIFGVFYWLYLLPHHLFLFRFYSWIYTTQYYLYTVIFPQVLCRLDDGKITGFVSNWFWSYNKIKPCKSRNANSQYKMVFLSAKRIGLINLWQLQKKICLLHPNFCTRRWVRILWLNEAQ